MIDKELVSMCDCPEIQDRWEPKYGDMYIGNQYKNPYGIVLDKYMVNQIKRAKKGCECDKKKYIYIPRIEDVLEWLVPLPEVGAWKYRLDEITIDRLLCVFMQLSHNKSWNGEAWV